MPYIKGEDPIEELRRALGPAAANYNDVQLKRLHKELERMADFLVDLWIETLKENTE